MDISTDDAKAIKNIEREASEALTELGDLTITTKEELEGWASMLVDVVVRKQTLKEMETRITKPLNEALKAVRDLFAPARGKVEGMEKAIKGAMDVFREQSARKVAEAREALKGATDGAGQTEALRAISEAEDTDDASGATTTRKGWTYRVEDVAKVPPAFLMVNEAMVKAAIKTGARDIPGLRIFQEEKTVMRRGATAKE